MSLLIGQALTKRASNSHRGPHGVINPEARPVVIPEVEFGDGTETVYAFNGGSDGADPQAALLNRHGALYGTTLHGGSGTCPDGCGTVFKVTTAGAEKVLYSFQGGSDGATPYAGLLNVGGTLYGTTSQGTLDCIGGCGTVFSVTR